MESHKCTQIRGSYDPFTLLNIPAALTSDQSDLTSLLEDLIFATEKISKGLFTIMSIQMIKLLVKHHLILLTNFVS